MNTNNPAGQNTTQQPTGATKPVESIKGNASILETIKETKPTSKVFTLKCNIRLKTGMVAIPNQSDEEFTWELASVLAPSGGPLKGVSGVLERLIMPSIIDVSTNDNSFNNHIKEYWANFAAMLPCDSINKRDTTQGILIEFKFTLLGSYNIEKYEAIERIDDKYTFIHNLLEQQERDPLTNKTIYLDAEYYPDFIKLGFTLKHPRIANRVEDREKSPKIFGYIYEKAVSVKNDEDEMSVFATFSDNLKEIKDIKQANALLLLLGEHPSDADSLVDKRIIIYSLAKDSHKARVKVNSLFKDDNWEYKYLVKMGIQFGILKQPANSKLVQHADIIIGNDIDSAAMFLKTDPTGDTLLHIIRAKLGNQ